MRAWCPHCLYEASPNDFIKRPKPVPLLSEDMTDRYVRKENLKAVKVQTHMRKCPDCGKSFRVSSLLDEDTTSEDYARWVASYPGFFRGIDFEKWSKRLKEYGMSNDFWTVYKTTKAEIHGYSTYEEYKAAVHS